ncbi:protein kinase [Lujinxingia vulgaris]|uniref:non-specific serine/threonine protein kinase n=1 Tax=Lujinxingia vulgaris TaxID=2600176 RepID=A0A5C6XMA1_9DELT|nr:serine/threonine-protein kinase [Lujinxingia vulgaris]TXD38474.1 protein kinase [Lujinxingia vulgaris]
MSSSRDQRRALYEKLVGQTVADRYEIVSLMGFGGMGAVYEAIQRNMNRRIALKYIPSHNPVTAARFEREALTVSQLRHPNTVTVFDYGQTDDGFLYLTMEMLAGRTLTEAIKTEAPFSPKRAVHIASQICRSLAEAHKNGIVHRDVKPDNIFLIEVDGDPDVVKVLDFGIAKAVGGEDDVQLTGDGRIVGTPRYMSPEQILSQSVDHRSDIYSLGCIIFEMLCGEPPFQGPTTTALMISHAQDPPPPFAERLSEQALDMIPLALEHVVRRTMSKDPGARPQTTEELREELESALSKHHAALAAGIASPTSTGNHFAPSVPGGAAGGFGNTGNFTNNGQFTGTGNFTNNGHFTGTGQAMAPGAQPDPQKSGPNKGLIAAVVLALIIVLLLGVMVMRGQQTGESQTPDALVAAPAEPAPSPVEEPVEPDVKEPTVVAVNDTIILRLTTEPPGATILEGEDELGTTPYNLSVAPGGDPLAYRLHLEGYEPLDVRIPIDPERGLRQELSYELTAEERRPARRAPRTERRTQPREEVSQTEEAPAEEEAPTEPRRPSIELLDDGPRPKVNRL